MKRGNLEPELRDHGYSAQNPGTEFRGYGGSSRRRRSRESDAPGTEFRGYGDQAEDVARATSLHPSQTPPEQSSEATIKEPQH